MALKGRIEGIAEQSRSLEKGRGPGEFLPAAACVFWRGRVTLSHRSRDWRGPGRRLSGGGGGSQCCHPLLVLGNVVRRLG
jgi:hypothetical protein